MHPSLLITVFIKKHALGWAYVQGTSCGATHPAPGWPWAGRTRTPGRCSGRCWRWSPGPSGETAPCLTARKREEERREKKRKERRKGDVRREEKRKEDVRREEKGDVRREEKEKERWEEKRREEKWLKLFQLLFSIASSTLVSASGLFHLVYLNMGKHAEGEKN